MRRLSSRLVLFLLSLLVIAGCGPSTTGVPLRRRDRMYNKIVSLSPSTTEIVASALGIQNLAGRTSACNYPQFGLDKVPVVASVKPDWEKLQGIKPDFIVYDATLYSPQDVEKMKETGATVFGLNATTVDAYRVQIFELANFVGGSSSASTYIDRLDLERNAARGAAPETKRKVAIVLPGGNGSHMIAGTKSFIADVVRQSGGEPVGPESDRFVPLNAEALVGWNPDAIVVSANDKNDASGALAILKDPRLKTVNAIRNRRVNPMLGDVLLRMGGRVDKQFAAMSRIISAG